MDNPSLGFVHQYLPGRSPLTLLLLHGTGGNETSMLALGQSLAPDAGILSPRGKVMEGPLPRFFRRVAEGVFDLQDLTFRTNELADFVGEAARSYGFDAGKVVAVGYSNGANIAASTLLLRPRVLAGAILLRAQLPLEPETPPDLTGVRVLLDAGREDPLIPQAGSQALADALRDGGADVTLRWIDADHSLLGDELDGARAWLRQHFG